MYSYKRERAKRLYPEPAIFNRENTRTRYSIPVSIMVFACEFLRNAGELTLRVGIHEIDLAGDQYFPLDTIWHDIVGLVFLKGLPSLPQATPEQLATLAQYNADPPRFSFVMVEDDGSGKATGTTWVTPPFPTYSPSSTLTSPVSNAASPTATTTTPSTPVTPSAVSSAENLLATSPASADNVVWVTEVVTVTV